MVQVLLFHANADSGDRIRDILAAHALEAEVTHVRNVTGCLAALEQWRFDAVVLDYAPPPSEGSAILAAVKQWWSAIPVIALCAPSSEREGRMALQEGAVEYVPGDRLPHLVSTVRFAMTGTGPKTERTRSEAAG